MVERDGRYDGIVRIHPSCGPRTSYMGVRLQYRLFVCTLRLKSIGEYAFSWCRSLRLLILPKDIHLSNVGLGVIKATISHIVIAAGVAYERDDEGSYTKESNRRVNEWLVHRMDDSPFHKLCYSSVVTTQMIIGYLNKNGKNAVLEIDATYGMTPLHMLTMNPHAPVDSIASLLDCNIETAFCLDNQQKIPLEYARDYNVVGLVGMIASLCNHRNSLIHVGTDTEKNRESATKRRRI